MFQCTDRWSITFATYSMANGAKIIKNHIAIQVCNIFPLRLNLSDYHLSKCCADTQNRHRGNDSCLHEFHNLYLY